MKQPVVKQLLVTLTMDKYIPDVTDLVAGRSWSIDGMRCTEAIELRLDSEYQVSANTETSPDANVDAVRKKLLDRSLVGLAKYGVTTERKDLGLPEWLNHLQEELMDSTVYVQAQYRRAVVLEQLAKLLYSYNPDMPMGEGMKATFLELRKMLD